MVAWIVYGADVEKSRWQRYVNVGLVLVALMVVITPIKPCAKQPKIRRAISSWRNWQANWDAARGSSRVCCVRCMREYHVWLMDKESRTDLYQNKAVEDVRLLLCLVVLRLVALCRPLHHTDCVRQKALDEAAVYRPDSLVQQYIYQNL
jgi:hypothetical protein